MQIYYAFSLVNLACRKLASNQHDKHANLCPLHSGFLINLRDMLSTPIKHWLPTLMVQLEERVAKGTIFCETFYLCAVVTRLKYFCVKALIA